LPRGRLRGIVPAELNGNAGCAIVRFFNAHDGDVPLNLPQHESGWELLLDTAGNPQTDFLTPKPADGFMLTARSLAVFRSRNGG